MDWKAFEQQLKEMLTNQVINPFQQFRTDAKEDIGRLKTRMDGLEGQLMRPDAGRKATEMTFPNYETPGARLIKQASEIDLFKKTGRVRFNLGQFHPDFSTKTLVDSASLGFATPGIINAERIDGMMPLPRRRLVVRDLLRSKPVTAGQVDWIQGLTETNAASPQSEGNEKGESGATWQIASEKVRTLAHWLPVSRQAADDLPELRRWIDEVLMYGLKLIEEWELLFGDGTGEHLHGLTHQATAYAGTYLAANDKKLDTLRHAILELEAADEECTAFVINPRDLHDIDLIKTEDSGTANTGSYLVGNPLGGTLRVRTLWGRPTVSTNVMPVGKFLAGNFNNAVIGDRMGAVIDVSSEHSDYFVRNKLAVRAEERLSLVSLDSGRSMRYGSF